jgi:hypothetical protein
VRALPSFRTVEIEPDIMLDIGSDGLPVGYDIQHASTKTEFIARLILEQAPPAAAE